MSDHAFIDPKTNIVKIKTFEFTTIKDMPLYLKNQVHIANGLSYYETFCFAIEAQPIINVKQYCVKMADLIISLHKKNNQIDSE